jgi:hypothetical protein
MPCDVFEGNPLGSAFTDDAGDLGPEVAWIVGIAALSDGADGLAGISGENRVKGTAEGPGIEAAQVVPNWCRDEISCALGGNEHGPWPFLPFDEGAGVIAGFGEHKAHIQASAACAEGQSVPGT